MYYSVDTVESNVKHNVNTAVHMHRACVQQQSTVYSTRYTAAVGVPPPKCMQHAFSTHPVCTVPEVQSMHSTRNSSTGPVATQICFGILLCTFFTD